MVPAVYEKYHVILSIPVEPNSSYYKDSDFLLYTKNLPNKKNLLDRLLFLEVV